MQDDAVRVGAVDGGLVKPVRLEDQRPFARFGLLAHGCPDVGVQDVSALFGLGHVLRDHDAAAGASLAGELLGALHDLRDGLVTRRRGHPDRHAGLGPADEQRMRDVVPVPDVGERQTFEPALVLPDGQQVGQALARVLEVRQRVHDGHGGGAGQGFEPLLAERAEDDRVDVAGQDPAGVLDGFPPAELELRGRQGKRVRPQTGDADLERDAGPGGGFLEDHRHGQAAQAVRVVRRRRLDLVRQVEERGELARREVVHREEVPAHGGAHRKRPEPWAASVRPGSGTVQPARSSAPTSAASRSTIVVTAASASSSVRVRSGARKSSE